VKIQYLTRSQMQINSKSENGKTDLLDIVSVWETNSFGL